EPRQDVRAEPEATPCAAAPREQQQGAAGEKEGDGRVRGHLARLMPGVADIGERERRNAEDGGQSCEPDPCGDHDRILPAPREAENAAGYECGHTEPERAQPVEVPVRAVLDELVACAELE